MINIGIVEDDKSTSCQLMGYIADYMTSIGENYQSYVFEDGIDIVDSYEAKWDIILMDIKMRHMDGIVASKKIREFDEKVIIIFITTLANYAINGYEVDALDFILKPVSYIGFEKMMHKAIGVIYKRTNKKDLLLCYEDHKERVSTKDIFYIEVRSHISYFITDKKIYIMRYALSKLEIELKEYGFARCSHSYLVNLNHITSIHKDTVNIYEHYIPISRPKKKQFLKEVSDHFMGEYD